MITDNMSLLALVIVLGIATAVVLIWKDSPAVATIAKVGGIAFILEALISIARFLLKG